MLDTAVSDAAAAREPQLIEFACSGQMCDSNVVDFRAFGERQTIQFWDPRHMLEFIVI